MSILLIGAATARNARPRNEDAIGIDGWMLSGEPARALRLSFPSHTLIAVADGLGGAPDGDLAARLGVQVLTAAASTDPAASADEESVRGRFRRADAVIREAARVEGNGMACCATLLAVHDERTVLIGHVGDVRLYRRTDSYFGLLTEDHLSPLDRGVTRCLGGIRRDTIAEPEVARLGLTLGDRFVLCTDGVHAELPPDHLRDCAAIADPGEAAETMVAGASGADNATAVVIDFTASDPAPPTAPDAVAEEPAWEPEPRGRRRSGRLTRAGRA